MQILYFTKYSRLGASSRLRSYQYFSYLEENGLEISVSPLFNDYYLTSLYQKKHSKFTILKAYLERFIKLFTFFRYDKVVIEKELFPYAPAWTEQIIKYLGVSYYVDYDDAIFHNYDLHKSWIIRFLLRNKIDIVMKNSTCVIAGNNYLANRAKNAGASSIKIIPTVVDLKRYKNISIQKDNYTTIIGWIGSPSTYKYFKKLIPVFKQLANQYDINFHIIGAKAKYEKDNCFHFIPWKEVTEASEISKFDIGIMPLDDTPWELGKCSYKLIQYMACSLPVVASPVGMNKEVVQPNNGILASSQEDWFNALEKLILNKSLQIKMGLMGRNAVEQMYSLQITNNKWLQLLKNESA
ncbi:glycosyltransferase family 4 protein [Nonlabens sp.]|uniref:glycosyltransferase family 4 protein n=1 Tax=Nonlabens sp. TaxID=1888209 RepID=UPI003F69C443